MSRGPGRVQRTILELVDIAADDTGFPRPVTTDEVLLALSVDAGIYGAGGSTLSGLEPEPEALSAVRAHSSRAEVESVRRAMRVLDRADKIDLFTVRKVRPVRIPTWTGTRHHKADKWILAARRPLSLEEQIEGHDRDAADYEERAQNPLVLCHVPQWAEEWRRRAEWHRAEAARLRQVAP